MHTDHIPIKLKLGNNCYKNFSFLSLACNSLSLCIKFSRNALISILGLILHKVSILMKNLNNPSSISWLHVSAAWTAGITRDHKRRLQFGDYYRKMRMKTVRQTVKYVQPKYREGAKTRTGNVITSDNLDQHNWLNVAHLFNCSVDPGAFYSVPCYLL